MANKKAKKNVKKTNKKTVKKPVVKKSVVKKTKSQSKRTSNRSLKKTKGLKGKRPDKTIAIIALLLNVLVIPGLGSLIGGKTKAGIWQLILAVIGGLLSIILIGIPILVAAWIWGLVTGINLIQESN
jgi:TM2 domain-containing membrane protein YozV